MRVRGSCLQTRFTTSTYNISRNTLVQIYIFSVQCYLITFVTAKHNSAQTADHHSAIQVIYMSCQI